MGFLVALLLIGVLLAMLLRIRVVGLFVFFIVVSVVWHLFKGG